MFQKLLNQLDSWKQETKEKTNEDFKLSNSEPAFIVDVGAFEIKYGLSSANTPQTIFNRCFVSKGKKRNPRIFGKKGISADTEHAPYIQTGDAFDIFAENRHYSPDIISDICEKTNISTKKTPICHIFSLSRQKQSQFAFVAEHYLQNGAPKVFLGFPEMGLWSRGRTSGLLIDVGHNHTTCAFVSPDESPCHVWESKISEARMIPIPLPGLPPNTSIFDYTLQIAKETSFEDLKRPVEFTLPDGRNFFLKKNVQYQSGYSLICEPLAQQVEHFAHFLQEQDPKFLGNTVMDLTLTGGFCKIKGMDSYVESLLCKNGLSTIYSKMLRMENTRFENMPQDILQNHIAPLAMNNRQKESQFSQWLGAKYLFEMSPEYLDKFCIDKVTWEETGQVVAPRIVHSLQIN